MGNLLLSFNREPPRDVCCFLFEVFTLFPWFDSVSRAVTSSREADQIHRRSGATPLHATVRESRKKEEMAIHNNLFAVRLAFVVALAFLPADVSAESTKTVELDIRPGGTVYTFTEGIVRNFYPRICFILHCALVDLMGTPCSQTKNIYRLLEKSIYPSLQKLVLIRCMIMISITKYNQTCSVSTKNTWIW